MTTENSQSSRAASDGFLVALTLLFIALKLGVGGTQVVGWSWWWVLAPMWVPSALTGLAMIVFSAYLALKPRGL